ncbi:unnamed protein product [Ilex paraguariensis]|uniref:Uncharacterized protein n=1 Tax=Ilex paraguariensis TaxID=185542 RepID=A0ABC8T1A5_9AQUA
MIVTDSYLEGLSSDYEYFYDSEYDIIDDQLYEPFVDKDVEFVGVNKGKRVDKGKGVDSERGTTKDVDNDFYAEDYESEELLSLGGSSSDDEEGGHCGSYGKCITKWFKVKPQCYSIQIYRGQTKVTCKT